MATTIPTPIATFGEYLIVLAQAQAPTSTAPMLAHHGAPYSISAWHPRQTVAPFGISP